MATNGTPSETHTESQVYLSTRGGDQGVSFPDTNWPPFAR